MQGLDENGDKNGRTDLSLRHGQFPLEGPLRRRARACGASRVVVADGAGHTIRPAGSDGLGTVGSSTSRIYDDIRGFLAGSRRATPRTNNSFVKPVSD